jgi:hypothetical protein
LKPGWLLAGFLRVMRPIHPDSILVGGLEHGFYDFQYILGMPSSQLLLTPSFLRGVGIPPTRYGLIMFNMILIWFNILYILYITNQFAFILKSSDNGMFVADPGASEL